MKMYSTVLHKRFSVNMLKTLFESFFKIIQIIWKVFQWIYTMIAETRNHVTLLRRHKGEMYKEFD